MNLGQKSNSLDLTKCKFINREGQVVGEFQQVQSRQNLKFFSRDLWKMNRGEKKMESFVAF